MARSGQGGIQSLLLIGGFASKLKHYPLAFSGVFLIGIFAGLVSRSQPARQIVSTDPTSAPDPGAAALVSTTASRRAETAGNKGIRIWGDKGKGIRFASYNLKNYLMMSREGEGAIVQRGPKPESEISVVVDTISQMRPEILGVCEIGGMSEVEDLRARLRMRGVDYPQAEWVDAADEDRHLALLTTFSIVNRRSQTGLTYLLGDKEFPVQRGFLDATISVNPKYQLRCIGVHLKSKRDVAEGEQDLMRRNEAHLLRRYLDEVLRAEPEVNLMVYGDFNDSCNEPIIRSIQGLRGSPGYFGSIHLKDEHGEAWTHHWSSADIYSRIDFLLYSKGLSPEIDHEHSFIYGRDDWEGGSDHRMIVAGIVPADRRR